MLRVMASAQVVLTERAAVPHRWRTAHSPACAHTRKGNNRGGTQTHARAHTHRTNPSDDDTQLVRAASARHSLQCRGSRTLMPPLRLQPGLDPNKGGRRACPNGTHLLETQAQRAGACAMTDDMRHRYTTQPIVRASSCSNWSSARVPSTLNAHAAAAAPCTPSQRQVLDTPVSAAPMSGERRNCTKTV